MSNRYFDSQDFNKLDDYISEGRGPKQGQQGFPPGYSSQYNQRPHHEGPHPGSTPDARPQFDPNHPLSVEHRLRERQAYERGYGSQQIPHPDGSRAPSSQKSHTRKPLSMRRTTQSDDQPDQEYFQGPGPPSSLSNPWLTEAISYEERPQNLPSARYPRQSNIRSDQKYFQDTGPSSSISRPRPTETEFNAPVDEKVDSQKLGPKVRRTKTQDDEILYNREHRRAPLRKASTLDDSRYGKSRLSVSQPNAERADLQCPPVIRPNEIEESESEESDASIAYERPVQKAITFGYIRQEDSFDGSQPVMRKPAKKDAPVTPYKDLPAIDRSFQGKLQLLREASAKSTGANVSKHRVPKSPLASGLVTIRTRRVIDSQLQTYHAAGFLVARNDNIWVFATTHEALVANDHDDIYVYPAYNHSSRRLPVTLVVPGSRSNIAFACVEDKLPHLSSKSDSAHGSFPDVCSISETERLRWNVAYETAIEHQDSWRGVGRQSCSGVYIGCQSVDYTYQVPEKRDADNSNIASRRRVQIEKQPMMFFHTGGKHSDNVRILPGMPVVDKKGEIAAMCSRMASNGEDVMAEPVKAAWDAVKGDFWRRYGERVEDDLE